MTYDRVYEENSGFFGAQPDALLERFADLIPRGHPVLDVGMGQGRNALYLARRGFEVHGFDPSRVAVETVTSLAEREGLAILCVQADFESYAPRAPGYSAVLLFGLIQMLPWEGIGRLIEKVMGWTSEGGFVFVTAFSREDSSCERYRRECTSIGRNSFLTEAGDIRTFLDPDELLDLFRGFKAVHHWEGLGPSHRHGKGPEERHARIEAVFQKAVPSLQERR